MIRAGFPREKLVCLAQTSVVRCKVPRAFLNGLTLPYGRLASCHDRFVMGKAVQERVCVISRFIDRKMKSEEFPECPFHSMALHGESVEWVVVAVVFSVFLFWPLVVPAYFF